MHLTRVILEYVRRSTANNNLLKNRNKPKELLSKEKKNGQTNDKQMCGTVGSITDDQSHNQMNSVHVGWPVAEETGMSATSVGKEKKNVNE